MKREVSNKTILDKFVEDFIKVVEKHCEYIIASGFVAISLGRTRGTENIDLIIEKVSKEQFIELHNDLINNDFECIHSSNPEIIYF